jgi:cysteine desulfurase family protein (TIGR01976 family)
MAASSGLFSDADLRFIRSQFPGLTDEWALFDNAGGSVPLGSVTARVTDYMTRLGLQLYATYAGSVESTRRVAEGHAAAARLVGADADEVFLGSASTACVRILAQALRPLFRGGGELVVTDLDHDGNSFPWRELAADGAVVREWAFDRDTHELTAAGLDKVLNSKTKLVCFTHLSNIVGTVHDAAGLVKRIHAAGALACIDGVAFAPHRRIDVRAIGADFYFLSLYKVFGPHIGMMYAKRGLLRRANPLKRTAEAGPPFTFEPGSVSHELAAAVPAILEYLTALDERLHPGAPLPEPARLERVFRAITAHETALAAPVLDLVRSKKGVRLLGRPGADRAPTIAFTIDGRDSATVPPLLDARKVAIRYGDFCAHRAAEELDIASRNGVVRATLAHYNSPAEVKRLVRGLEEAL